MKKIYLAGAIEVYGRKGNYDEANQWRKKVKNYFSNYLLDFECVNPMDYYLYDSSNHKNEFEVMRFDLRLVKQADILLVNLDYIRDSIGTSDEIFYAYMLGKPVIGFIEGRITELDVPSIMNMIHPWKYYQIDRIETGPGALDKAMEYIKDFMVDEDRRIIMNVVLYTTHCSNCRGIEKMLTQKNIPFTEITDVEEMMKKGIMSAPVLEVDGNMMNVGQAAKWIMNQ